MGIVVRILSIAVMLALLLSSGAVAPAAAEGEVTVSVNAPAEVTPGDNFTATVDISQVQNFDATDYDVSFDPTVLEITIPLPSFNATQMYGQINGTTIPVDIVNLIHAGSGPADPTVIKLVQNVEGLSGVSGSGYLAILPFRVTGFAGQSSNINLSDGVLSDNVSQEIPAIWMGDVVQVTGVDTTPPTVLATSPPANAIDVPVNTTIQVIFSESMNATSVQSAFSISPTVLGSFIWADSANMTFTPFANLSSGTAYTATVNTTAEDLAGNPLAQAKIWSFTTEGVGVVERQTSLVDGWNIIALAVRPAEGYTASTLAADINSQGGHVTQVFWWNATAGSWDFYLVDIQYGTDFNIEVGYGYLLQNTTPTTWTYSGEPLSAEYTATFEPRVTNVGDKSFTVSWVSQNAEQGYVNYGESIALGSPASDNRGEATEDDTHYVSIAGLKANTKYYYEIVSGGVPYDNGGTPYEITTGPGLTFVMPEMINGKVYQAGGGTAAAGAIVYGSIGTSQVLSALVDASGTWALNIAPIRAGNYQSYYTHTDSDVVSIAAQGAADGTASQAVTIAIAKTGAPDMEVSIVAEVSLVDGWNLIALPVEPATSYTASSMAAEINTQGGHVTQVFWWNATAGSWDFYLVDIQYGTDFNVELGEGYLLLNTEASTWSIQSS